MTEKQQRVCGNHLCKTSNTPLWRKGWTDANGAAVMLCNACGLHFKKKHYCLYCNQIYREADAENQKWISCDRCSRWTHVSEEQSHGFEITKLKNQYLCPECRDVLNLKTAEEVDNAADLDVIKKRRRKPTSINARNTNNASSTASSKKRSRSSSDNNDNEAGTNQPPAKKRKKQSQGNVFSFEAFCSNASSFVNGSSSGLVPSKTSTTIEKKPKAVQKPATTVNTNFGETLFGDNDSNHSFYSGSSSTSTSNQSPTETPSAFGCPYEISVENVCDNDVPSPIANPFFIDSTFLVPPHSLERPQPTNYSMILQKMMKKKTVKYPASHLIDWTFKHMARKSFGDDFSFTNTNYVLMKFIPVGDDYFGNSKPYSNKQIQKMLFGGQTQSSR